MDDTLTPAVEESPEPDVRDTPPCPMRAPAAAPRRGWRRRGPAARVWLAPRRLRTALALARDPEGFFEYERRRRGLTFWLWLPGVDPTLVTGDPAGAREIFQCAVDVFDAPRGQPLEPVFGQHSIVLNSGDAHRRQRQLVMPAFRGERMAAFGDLMRQMTREALARMSPGQPFLGHALAQEITLHIIIRAIFGVTEPQAAREVETATVRFLQTYTPFLMLLPFTRNHVLSAGQWWRFVEARRRLDDLLERHINQRRADLVPAADILSQLIPVTDDEGRGLTNSELKDELRTMLVAGHDTTASSMAWALYFIHQRPELRERLLADLAALGPDPSPESLNKLPFLEAVCQEAIRLHPPIQLAVRQVKEPRTLRGHVVEPGENIAVSLRLLHTAPEVWERGEEFRPERFSGRTYAPWEFAPFGGGGRRCVGAAFGTFELRIVLGTLLARANLELQPQRPPRARLRGIIVGPDNRVPMRYLGPKT